MEKINEVIIVEGRDDIRRIKEVLDADIIETHGMGLNEEIMKVIEEAYQKRGIIIFTDPDYAGETIRKQITARCPEAKHAFITRKEGEPNKQGSLGVEHASDQAIIQALTQVATPRKDKSDIELSLLQNYGLLGGVGAKQKRKALGEALRIGYTNGKQLKKRLQAFNITKEQLQHVMEEIEKNERL